MEAAESESDVKGFEVGVFCGKYKTEVPKGYFEHLGQLQGKKRQNTVSADEEEEGSEGETVLIANSGPMSVKVHDNEVTKGGKSPEHREDIKYVVLTIHLNLRLVINNSTAFTTLQTNLKTR